MESDVYSWKVTRVGITGHQRLSENGDWAWVERALNDALDRVEPPLGGLSSLALGADQLFARLVLERAGELHVVLPFPGYDRFLGEKGQFNELLERATTVHHMHRGLPTPAETDAAYLDAGKWIVRKSDLLFAVWEGGSSAGREGEIFSGREGVTATIVRYAHKRLREVWIFDPLVQKVTGMPQPSRRSGRLI